jgi:putative transposase
MRCIGCGSKAVSDRSEHIAQGYRRFRCRDCCNQFNERSDSQLNRTQYPSDVIALVVLWRLRYKVSLRDLPEMFLIQQSTGAGSPWHQRSLPAHARIQVSTIS